MQCGRKQCRAPGARNQLAAARDAAPFALLFAQVKLASGQHVGVRVMGGVMGEVLLVGIISSQRSEDAPEPSESPREGESWTCHWGCTAARIAGTSDVGSTGSPLLTRQATRNVSMMTIQRIAVSRTASTASSR